MKRRDLLKAALALPVWRSASAASARVVVLGGGYGGATAAKYLKLWAPDLDVVLVEREAAFVSCPLSNLVLGGHGRIEDFIRTYDALRRRGIEVVHDEATAIDTARKAVRLQRGTELRYDRLVVSPGVDFMTDEIEGFDDAARDSRVLHAWKAGPQTTALRRQLEGMRDGGTFVITVPTLPYRCPPAPYERACQVASYFKEAKPRAKIIVLDANPDLTSKGALFRRAWQDLYPGMIDYRANANVIGVDAGTMEVKTDFENVEGQVLNVVPPQRAARIAEAAGLVTHNKRWCQVDWRSCESTAVKNVHVLGDATLAADAMPKAGHMANQQAKVCAAAVIALLAGREPDPKPVYASTCYSFLSPTEAVHVASVHQWDAARNTVEPVKGAGGLSAARSAQEAEYGWAWARNIWADTLG